VGGEKRREEGKKTGRDRYHSIHRNELKEPRV
jgi:hypothetical protein